MAKSSGVDYLREARNEHILESTELSQAGKLALADELKNDKLFVSVFYLRLVQYAWIGLENYRIVSCVL